MAKVVHTELPRLATIEEPVAEAPHYTEYWTELYHPVASSEAGCHLPKSQFRLAETFLQQVSENVIRQPEWEMVQPFPQFIDEKKQSPSNMILVWDRLLGSFNPMADGQADMLGASSVLLWHNAREMRVGEAAPVQTYEAYREMFAGVDMRRQRLGPRLLVAAQLVHKAAWLEPDAVRREEYLSMAGAMYGRVNTGKSDWAEGAREAQAYLADIRHHQAAKAFRDAGVLPLAEGQRRRQQATESLRQLLHRDAHNVQQLCDKYEESRNDKGPLKGFIFERFVPLLLRDTVMADLEAGAEDVVFEVRRAFRSEDKGPFERPLNPNFDMVVQRYVSHEETVTTPVQLKIGRARNKSRYLGNIIVVRAADLSIADVRAAATELERQYGENVTPHHRKAYVELQERLQEELLAA